MAVKTLFLLTLAAAHKTIMTQPVSWPQHSGKTGAEMKTLIDKQTDLMTTTNTGMLAFSKDTNNAKLANSGKVSGVACTTKASTKNGEVIYSCAFDHPNKAELDKFEKHLLQGDATWVNVWAPVIGISLTANGGADLNTGAVVDPSQATGIMEWTSNSHMLSGLAALALTALFL